MRRRRSALQTPAFVERMDVAEDADGRVAIFTVDAGEDPAVPARTSRRHGAHRPAFQRLGGWMDAPYAGLVLAATLAVILALGLLVLRR